MEPTQPKRRNASFLRTMKAIFWSFFGVRKGEHSVEDGETLNPIHVVIAGVLGAAVLIAVLLGIVKLVLAK